MFPTLSPQIDHRTSSPIAKGPPPKTTADNRSRVPAIHVLPSTKLIKNKEEKSFHSINRYFHATHAIPLRKSRDEKKNKSLLKLFNRWKNLPEIRKNLKTSRKKMLKESNQKRHQTPGPHAALIPRAVFFFESLFFKAIDDRPPGIFYAKQDRGRCFSVTIGEDQVTLEPAPPAASIKEAILCYEPSSSAKVTMISFAGFNWSSPWLFWGSPGGGHCWNPVRSAGSCPKSCGSTSLSGQRFFPWSEHCVILDLHCVDHSRSRVSLTNDWTIVSRESVITWILAISFYDWFSLFELHDWFLQLIFTWSWRNLRDFSPKILNHFERSKSTSFHFQKNPKLTKNSITPKKTEK